MGIGETAMVVVKIKTWFGPMRYVSFESENVEIAGAYIWQYLQDNRVDRIFIMLTDSGRKGSVRRIAKTQKTIGEFA